MPHLLLQLEDAIHERLAGRRAPRHVNIDRHYPVAAPRHAVTIMIIPAPVRARAHADHPAGVGHLVVDLAQGGRHLVREGAGDDHDVRLARRRAEDYPEPVLVVARRGQVHHLDGAAREAEGHRPEGGLAGPVRYLVEGGSFWRSVSLWRLLVGEKVPTYSANCMTPSFFSWLGSGTSRRGLPVTLSGGPSFDCVCSAVALFDDEDDMKAAGPAARKGTREVEGLAFNGLVVCGERVEDAIRIAGNAYLVELVKLSI